MSSAAEAALPSVTSAIGDAGPRTTRASDVHSILNPKAEPVAPQRRPSAVSESPPSTLATPQYTPSSLSRATLPEADRGTPPAIPSGMNQPLPPGQVPRRILTPKSPSMRKGSLGHVGPPGTINAQKSPFISGARPYAAEPGYSQASEVPPIPTPPAQSRLSGSSYGFPTTAPTPPQVDRRLSVGTTQASQSQSTSPTTSYSSYGQVRQPSPGPQHVSGGVSGGGSVGPGHPVSSASYYPPTGAPSHLPNGSPVSASSSATYRSPGGALAQSSYQLLTLDTDQGPIQVPVDVQAASKMADDKRKRNAGASARFRQRRKEKEREASQTIAKLEQQIRDITEEREFYRQERDHFRRVAAAQGVQTRRPPSPHHQQHQQGPPEMPRVRQLSATSWSDAGMPETSDRSVRQRTDGYQPGQSFSLPPLTTSAATTPGLGPPSAPLSGQYPPMSAGPDSTGPSPTTAPGEGYEQFPRRLQVPGPGFFASDRR